MIYKIVFDKKSFRTCGTIGEICELLDILSKEHTYMKSYLDSHSL